ncbi:MAG: hypothetical protein H0X43_09925 [Nitrosospira sp.]|nr:hypothetical protein [Nitrosospira sp.]
MRDVVVVGASSGRIEALKKLTGGRGEDFNASVLVAMHMSLDRSSILPEILNLHGSLS